MRSYLWLFWSLAITGLILDQTSKYGIFGYLYNQGAGGQVTIVENYFTIEANYLPAVWEDDGSILYKLRTLSGEHRPTVNEGTLFGFGRGYNWVFTGVSIVAALLIIIFSNRLSIRQDLLLCFALGLILAGTLGNFYDRLVFSGVRDFIHWFIAGEPNKPPVFDWPIFNIADSCLVVGAGTLLLHALFIPEPAASLGTAKEQESVAIPS